MAPGFECLPDSTRARDEGDETKTTFQAQANRPSTIGLTVSDDTADPLEPESKTRLDRHRDCCPVTAVASTHPEASGYAPIPAHTETEEHLFELVPPICAMSIGRPRSLWRLRCVLLGPIERNRRGILMEPRRRDGITLPGLEGNGPKDPGEIRRQQRLENLPQPVIIA